jgi:hypothetical protein
MMTRDKGASMSVASTFHPRRLLLLATAVVLLGASLVLSSGTAPAQATAAQCTPPTNGFVNPISGANAHVVRYFNYAGTTTSLQWKYVNGVQVGFAYIGGSTAPGDLVWMDWSRDGGRTWIQCGPFSVIDWGAGRRTYAQRTSSDSRWVFRACSRLYGDTVSQCTTWW